MDRYGCISESVSAFRITLAVGIVKSCISRSVVVRLSGVGPSFGASVSMGARLHSATLMAGAP